MTMTWEENCENREGYTGWNSCGKRCAEERGKKRWKLQKKGALDGLTKEQRLEIYKSLMTLRNMEIIHYLAKQEEKFSSEMLRMDFEPYLNKNFVRQVLARYGKKFDLTDERECENLFEIACEANDAETVKYLIRQDAGKIAMRFWGKRS